MSKQNAPARNRDPDCITHQRTDLHAHNQRTRFGFQHLGDAHTHRDAGLEVEMMQKQAEVDDIHLAVHAAEQEILFVEDVAGEEGALEGFAIAEELEAEIHELAVEVGAVDVLGGRAVGDEFADVLREAAA